MAGLEERASLTAFGTRIDVTHVNGKEGVSTLFEYEAHLPVGGELPPLREILGKAATLTLRDGYAALRPIHAIIASARTHTEEHGKQSLVLTLRPEAFRLTLGRDCRVFQDMTVIEIVKDVLGRAKIPAHYRGIHPRYRTREYTAQYRESDWDFLSRLLEEEGIYYWFDHEEAESQLTFADESSSAPDLVGGARVGFSAETGMGSSVELIEELGGATRMTSTRFSLAAFDDARPHFKLGGSVGRGKYEVYDSPGGGAQDDEACKARAHILLEETGVERNRAVGRTSSFRLVPGRVVEVFDHPVRRFEGRFFVTWMKVELRQRVKGGAAPDENAMICRFGAVPIKTPFRPAAATPPARQAGLQSGVVVGEEGAEVHPDAAGRVRVQLHWDREGARDHKAGKWMRVAQRGTGGSMLLPRVGWNVLTMNEEGSVDAPTVVSRIFDAEHPPPYPLPAAKTRTVFKTATTPGGGSFNEIRYEDKAGSEEMFVNASRDMSVLVNNEKTEAIKSNAARTVGSNHALTVGNNAADQIAGSQSMAIGGSESETVDGGREKLVNGNEASVVAGSRSQNTKSASETSVGGGRSLAVGAAQIDASIGDIQVKSPIVNVLVGGAMIKLTPRAITEDVGMTLSASMLGGAVAGAIGGIGGQLASAALGGISGSVGAGGVIQTIGGAKIELTAKERGVAVSKSYRETVGGALIMTTPATFLEQASYWSINVGGKLSAVSPDIVISALTSIEIKSGGTTLTITDSGVTLKGAKIDLAGGEIAATAASIEHN